MSEPEPTVGAFTRHDAYLLALRLLADHADALINDIRFGRVSLRVPADNPRGLNVADLGAVVHFLEKERYRLLETIARHEAQRT